MNSLSASSHKPLFPRGPGLGLKTLALLMVCGGLMAAELDGERIKSPREWLAVALRPVVWMAELPDQVGLAFEHLDSRQRLLNENIALKNRQLTLEAQLQRYAALDAENRRIRELLDASARLTDQVAVADIVAANQDPYRQQITLNKGERDGVYRGQAIIDASGVLGQVVEVLPGTSIGLLLTDPDHGIPVEINRNGLQAIALGQGSGQRLRLSFLPANAEIMKGDLVVSSSLGGRFPAGFPVGRVESVEHTPGGHFKEALVTPAARVGQGRQALLVWSERPAIDALQASEAAAAEAQQIKPAASAVAAKPAAKPAVAAKPATPAQPTQAPPSTQPPAAKPAPASPPPPAEKPATPASATPAPAAPEPAAPARPAPTAPGP
ncbi:rod shape-determining protein MreC [Panacagrimonas perspica]|uniref:rod shape-determining protein MreC n=1 Tax=Panacagrimonas perspica TaxID=381431 RepID=UPI001447CC29|nr:rod shape-determining protein MreC [Panacagrimonas perspica]